MFILHGGYLETTNNHPARSATLMLYKMETVDFNNELSVRKSNVVVLTILKIEIAIAILFFFENGIGLAMVLAGVCAIINQFTEIYYLKKPMLGQKLLVLVKSLLVTLLFYAVAFLIHVDFTYHRHGQTGIDSYKIWLVVKLLVVVFVLLGAVRLLAFGGDWFINQNEQRKNFLPKLSEHGDTCVNK